MIKKIYSFITIAAVILTPISSIAERAPYRADFRAISTVSEFVPLKLEEKLRKKNRKVRVALRTYVPGLGPVKLRFNKEKLRSVFPTITSENGVEVDKTGISLLQGTLETKSKKSRAAASIYYKNNTPYLNIAFEGKNLRYKKTRFYRLSLPLNSQETTATVKRKIMSAEEHHCDDPLHLPHTETANLQTSSTSTSNLKTANLETSAASASSIKTIELNIDADREFHNIFGLSLIHI